MKKFLSLVLLTAFLPACQTNQPSDAAANKTVINSNTSSANNAPRVNEAGNKSMVNSNAANSSAMPMVEVKTCQTTGIVTEVRPTTGEIEMNHEECKPLMPAMKMMFHVKNKTELEAIKIGDKVEFTLEDRSGAEIITTVKKVK